MSLIAKKTFHAEIAQAFPKLNLGEDAWKIDQLAKQTYPLYKQTWITNKSDEKASARKHKMKMKTDPGDASSNHDHTSWDAKCQKIKPETNSGNEAANHNHTGRRDAKCQKVEDHDATSPPTPALQFITNMPLGQPSKQEMSTPVFEINPAELTLLFSGGPTSHRGNMYVYGGYRYQLQVIISFGRWHHGVFPSTVSLDSNLGSHLNSWPSTSLDQLGPSAQPTLDDLEAIPLPESKLIKLKNPLAMMPQKLPVVQSAFQPVASSPPEETPLSSKESVIVGPSRTITNAQTAASSSKPSEAAVPGGTQSSALKKGGHVMHIPMAQTSQTRWNAREFGTYYDALSAQLKAKYKDKATKLVTEGIWMNGTAETIAKIAFLNMYN
ncbi:hypothetical protein L210DRAFT_3650686 [Boletus edulis BED1]|uniref:Uncharacterized protein n=1 Tax=Boletus edulis BED1 TaxID=1328754 RepID=A0AAD4BIP8_BOLED|nr:hypothetical protein L210DRAFT_3650686 [Boletus edulis BED1]